MISQELKKQVQEWIEDDPDPVTVALLKKYLDEDNEKELRSCFSGFLEFGTAGLRAPLGPGPARMNHASVGRSAAGLARYMSARGLTSIVIGRDARHGSEDFSRDTAEIMSGAGFDVYLLPRPLPTPVLVFALKELQLGVGVMVTASHNPAQDNGYKVYLGGTVAGQRYEGSQIISPADQEISAAIATIKTLRSQPRAFTWTIVDEAIITKYVSQSAKIVAGPCNLKVVYTAMHGVGTQTLQSVFHSAGFAPPILVPLQSEPDPDFPTLTFPNPEEPGAIDLALDTARGVGAEIVIANDPDADRCAIALKDPDLGWRMLRGDEVGALLGEYISQRSPAGATFVNSIVSSSILKKIARHYGHSFRETLPGFKWISKVAGLTFGYEEALGYCVDPATVNDKDGISAALMVTKIAAELKSKDRSIFDYLDEIWLRHGFHGTSQISLRVTDLSQINTIMENFRKNPPSEVGDFQLSTFEDLEKPKDQLPPTNGVRFWLGENIRVIIRPSGTEAKIKCYIEVIVPVENGDRRLLPAAKANAAQTIRILDSLLSCRLSK